MTGEQGAIMYTSGDLGNHVTLKRAYGRKRAHTKS
jgi:hypothetical protein